MRLTTTTNVSVDGVMQGLGGPDEDRSGGNDGQPFTVNATDKYRREAGQDGTEARVWGVAAGSVRVGSSFAAAKGNGKAERRAHPQASSRAHGVTVLHLEGMP